MPSSFTEEGKSHPVGSVTSIKLLEELWWLHHRSILLACPLDCSNLYRKKSSKCLVKSFQACLDSLVLAVKFLQKCIFNHWVIIWYDLGTVVQTEFVAKTHFSLLVFSGLCLLGICFFRSQSSDCLFNLFIILTFFKY